MERQAGVAGWSVTEASDSHATFQWGDGEWMRAWVKRDGCVEFVHYRNVPFSSSPKRTDSGCCDSHIHICDVDEMIEQLTALREAAKAHFGEWPG